MPENFYELLEVEEDASTEEIKRAYRKRVREYHPDVNEDARATDQFRAIQRAYDTLTNPERRKAYDRLGHREYVRTRLNDEEKIAQEPDEERETGTAQAENDTSNEPARHTAPEAGANERHRRSPSVGGRPRQATPTGNIAAPMDARSERERAHVRRQMRRRRFVGRWGEPALAFATLWSFLLYAVGAAGYLGANADVIAATLQRLVTAPTGASQLLTVSSVQSGIAFSAASAAAGTSGLFFPVGAALMALTIFATVIRKPARWRHWAWWGLPVLGSGPTIGLLVQSQPDAILSPMAVAILLYGLAPVAALAVWIGFLYSRL